MVRPKTGYFDILAQQVRELGDGIILTSEKLFLIIKAGTPSEVRSNLQVFTETEAHHVRRVNAFGGIQIMRAAGGMYVMIAGPPSN